MPEVPSESPFLLNIQMIADSLTERSLSFTLHTADGVPTLRHCLLYEGQPDLHHDTLYILPEGEGQDFPRDCFSYVTPEDLPGVAPHIRSLRCPMHKIINALLTVFQEYQDFEVNLNRILNTGGTMTDLCVAASAFFRNPVYIHDDMFTIIGISSRVKGMLDFEYNENTGKLYIPLWLIDDFKFDAAYRNTLEQHQPAIWGIEQYPYNFRSLFMNLWDGDRYLGRVLINELRSSLQPGQLQAIVSFARYAVLLLRRDNDGIGNPMTYEDTMEKLMIGAPVESRELQTMLIVLGWKENDRFLCLELENQRQDMSIRSDSALMGKLRGVASSFSCFFHHQRLCIVVNLIRSGTTPGAVRRNLAPFVRDSCMYGGISGPVPGLASIADGFRQAEITLDYILNHDNRQWLLPFSACALHYILSCATKELPPQFLCSPALMELKKSDEENDTQYYETLREYLLHERSIPKAAEALIIHRTTLTYRLDKIQKLLKLNLEDPKERQYLIFSFFLLENQEKPERM